MKPRNGAVIALLLLATCNEESQAPVSPTIESAREALGKLPASEVATWMKVGSSTIPDGRYLQAAAFDESRKVAVMFGGEIFDPNMGTGSPSQETWEWNPATGKWGNRTGTGSAPDARSGAAMVYDSARAKFVLFGGRAGSGYNYEDTWEWDPVTGVWTDLTAAGSHPSARAQHGMVYEKSTGKILLFGGGRSDSASSDGTGVTVSIGDTWEFDPTTHVWAPVTIAAGAASPTARHDLGLVWDSTRNVAVLFAGMQTDSSGSVPKRDTWEFNPATHTWTEKTATGSKPSERYGHAMAFDGSRGKVVLFGGWDMSSGGSLNDVWEWDPATGVWTQRLTTNSPNLPSARMYASLVSDDARGRLEVLAGSTMVNPGGTGGMGGTTYFPGMGYGQNGSNQVWELDPVAATFVDRSTPIDVPPARTDHCMAYNPSTGKVYVLGGYDMSGQTLDDFWEWDGKVWAQVITDVRPPARTDAALAYDPARKSLILFGGTGYYGSTVFGDTWEWSGTTRRWSQLSPKASPDALYMHAMVTDTTRSKILLFGGMSNYYYYNPNPGVPYKDPMRNEIWEWDGNQVTWTNRTPAASTATPLARQFPILAYDEGRKKMFLFDGPQYGSYPASMSAFWEWDPISAGWSLRDPGDSLDYGYTIFVAYDSIRRREVLLTDATSSATGNNETWEIDAKGPTFYVRAVPNTPSYRYSAAMVFDSARGVVVLFGGSTGNGYSDETWEYGVTGWGNGEGCNATFAASCASGNCVDGVCCDSAACTGPCKSCNVSGSEGTCVLAKAGTEVAGSCSNGQACDGNGNCLGGNGQACTSAATCASGFCTDGVCCNNACNGTCTSCNLPGQAGKCSPYTAGTDPQNECGKGTGVCKSTCDGVGSCAYPAAAVPCASCTVCNGLGSCSQYDPYCAFTGGAGGGSGGATGRGGSGGYTTSFGGSGGYTTVRGGSGGYTTSFGGSGGYTTVRGGSGGSTTSFGGSGGYTTARGGSGGYTTSFGGSGGSTTSFGGSGGYTTVRGGSGGYTTNYGGSGGSTAVPGGSGGKIDGGAPKGGSTGGGGPDGGGITEARLRRSGCDCDLGRLQQTSNLGSLELSGPFILLGAALLRRRTQRKKQDRSGA